MLNQLLIDGRRRLAAIVAGTLVTLGASVAVSAPAEAAPSCGYNSYGHWQEAGSHITAFGYITCPDWDEFPPLPVSIYRYRSPDVWELVASGTGTTTYQCNGFAFNRYKTTGTAPFDILCG